jgi:putative ABC transport system permease protein
MENSVLFIPAVKLALAFIPVLAVIVILYKWSLNYRNSIYAISRMLLQLLVIGYLLTYIFESDSVLIIVAVLAIMLFASSWIALRSIGIRPLILLKKVLSAITIGGGITLILITQLVLDLQPWYWPRYFIPLAGMIFANAMNSVSLAAERLQSETERGVPYEKARAISLRASLIPITNSLFAVGLVALPGMMTGQILSGISPLLAVRYQIMVMCMVYSSAGISSFFFLSDVRDHLNEFKIVEKVMPAVKGDLR